VGVGNRKMKTFVSSTLNSSVLRDAQRAAQERFQCEQKESGLKQR